jgi:D-erythro-7,8-dihydroneopterin triphosphate epimerase
MLQGMPGQSWTASDSNHQRIQGKRIPMEQTFSQPRATIRISNLALRTIIGANGWEREKKQEVIINLALDIDPRAAIASDNLDDTLDYKRLKKSVCQLVESSQYQLLESLCGAILQICMANERVLNAQVRVDKPHALRFADSVSVEMSAERRGL